MKEKFEFVNVKKDVLSGFIVSLIALPLCLGVASASGFPPITGVLTAIIGGVIISFLSGSELAIKGPAAGLIVIIAGAVEEYGRGDTQTGYMLTASLIAVTGVLQIVLGFLKVGRWADFIPSSIVHGMLAAIGIIIMVKQFHLLVGINASELKGMEPLHLIMEIPRSLGHFEWHITLLGIMCLVLLFLLPRVKNPVIKSIPSFLIVIVFSIGAVQLFHLFSTKYTFYNTLVDPGKLKINFLFDSSIFQSSNLAITFKYIFLLTIIGTIESVLTVKAVDILDPYKRTSNYNKDIIAVGVGNLLCGLFGAIPMISEVARSSANINNKGVTRLSGFAHGLFLLIFVLIFVSLIKLIPLVALSAILIFVGAKLASPAGFIHAFKVSNEHLIVFLTTLITTIVTDLLVGVVAGIVIKIIINFAKSGELKTLFTSNLAIENKEKSLLLHIKPAAVFTNWLPVKAALSTANGKKIIVDFAEVKIVDSSFIDNMLRFKERYQNEFVLKDFELLNPLKNHPVSMRVKMPNGQRQQVQLSAHHKKLKVFCEENQFILSLDSWIPTHYFEKFKGFKHVDIRRTKAFVTGTYNGVKFEYYECAAYDTINMLEYDLNIMGVELANGKAPRFMMQRESKLVAVIDFVLKNQVNINERPVFNSMYSIYSRDKERMAQVFSKDTIDYFEENDLKDRIIEGDGDSRVILYENRKTASLLSFVYKLETIAMLKKGIS
ncbi:MAG: SulP family inorganic anion transporter [Bacteroidetes bacterium]|nr:SulP family inorganic anion transporter [Bacteroidota bacterium]